MFVKPFFFLNLPGWRWGSITQNPLVAVSRPLHSGVCETRQDIGLPVLHSEISDSGLLRTRGDQQTNKHKMNRKFFVFILFFSCVRFCVCVVVSRVFCDQIRCELCCVLCVARCVMLRISVLRLSSLFFFGPYSSSWGRHWCTPLCFHRSHFGSRYQSGRCALRSPFIEPGSFESRWKHIFRFQLFFFVLLCFCFRNVFVTPANLCGRLS